MKQHLSPPEMELYERTDEVLHYIWDPIGVSGVPEARDEYNSYVPHVFSMLSTTLDGKDISTYLLSVESDKMGFTITDKSRERVSEVVDILISYRDLINEKSVQLLLHGSE